MTNTIDALVAQLWAKALVNLRQKIVLPRTVRTDFSAELSKEGDTINFPYSTGAKAKTVVPGVTRPASDGRKTANRAIILNQWKYSDFELTQRDAARILKDRFFPNAFDDSVSVLAKSINEETTSNYVYLNQSVGDPNTPMFDSSKKLTLLNEAAGVLDEAGVLEDNRVGLLNNNAKTQFRNLDHITEVHKAGSDKTLRTGRLGEVFGINLDWQSGMPTHVNGDLSDGSGHQALVKAGASAGAKSFSINATSLTGTLTPGTLFTVAGDSQQYTVLPPNSGSEYAASANEINNINIYPSVEVDWADGALVTFLGDPGQSYRQSLVYHRDWLGVPSRVLTSANNKFAPTGAGKFRSNQIDPMTGLTFTLTYADEHFQDAWLLSVFWGSGVIRPECGVRVIHT